MRQESFWEPTLRRETRRKNRTILSGFTMICDTNNKKTRLINAAELLSQWEMGWTPGLCLDRIDGKNVDLTFLFFITVSNNKS